MFRLRYRAVDGWEHCKLPVVTMFKDRSISIPVLLCAVVALIVATALGARPTYQKYKHWRALQLVTEVRTKLIPAKDWVASDHSLRLALGFAPMEPEVLRLAAQYLTLAGSETSLQYYSMLIHSGAATVEDRLLYARQGLGHSRPDIAREQIGKILESVPLHRDALLTGIEALERLGLAEDATRLADVAFQAYPGDDEAALRLGLLQLNRPDPAMQSKGKRILWGLAISPKPQRMAAIDRLTQDPTLDRSELKVLVRILAAFPARTLAQDLTWFDLRRRLAPALEQPILATLAIQRLGPSPSTEERLLVADWILVHDASERINEVISEELCRAHAGAAQRWIQAKANVNRWDEVLGLIDDNSLSIAPELRHCFRAQVQHRQGNTNAVNGYLKQAVALVRSNPEHVAVVAGYAERLGQPKLAAEAYEKLLANPVQVNRAAHEIVRLLAGSDDVQDLLSTLRRVHQFQPENLEVADLIGWFELILRQRIGANADEAKARFQKVPDSDRFRLTLALAELRQDNPEAALALLEERKFDPTNGPVRVRLLFVAALGAAGQRQTAQQLARSLDVRSLKPEEIELIQPWRELSIPGEPRTSGR